MFEFVDGTLTEYRFPISHEIRNNTWHALKIEADSLTGELTTHLNSVYLASHQVTSPNRTGQSGLYSGNAGGFFDDFVVTSSDIPPPDEDEDGVLDADDQCLKSILTPTVVLGVCDSGVQNHIFATGCTISDLIFQIAATARNKGAFVSGVATLTNRLRAAGTISGREKGAIQSCAARAGTQ